MMAFAMGPEYSGLRVNTEECMVLKRTHRMKRQSA